MCELLLKCECSHTQFSEELRDSLASATAFLIAAAWPPTEHGNCLSAQHTFYKLTELGNISVGFPCYQAGFPGRQKKWEATAVQEILDLLS